MSGSGSDSAVRFSRAARQIDRHQRTFATTIKSSHSGRFRLLVFEKKSPMGGSRSSRPSRRLMVDGDRAGSGWRDRGARPQGRVSGRGHKRLHGQLTPEPLQSRCLATTYACPAQWRPEQSDNPKS
jgi:hypothetical protein